MRTFLAPPAMCFLASSALVKRPVDSMTMSTPSSPQGRLAGSRSSKTLICLAADGDASPRRSVTSSSSDAADGVVLEQVRERLVVGEVVHRHDVEVRALRESRAEVVASDAAEAVDSDLDSHGSSPEMCRARERGCCGCRRMDNGVPAGHARRDAPLATTVPAGPTSSRGRRRSAGRRSAQFGDVPDRLDVVGLDVEVVEVEGVLPHVELEHRDGALRGVATAGRTAAG